MKLNKTAIFGCMAAMALASCQETPVTPTGDAVVGFESATVEAGMGSSYIHIPIVTTGESSVYPIKVYIEDGGYTGMNAAREGIDYILTSNEILIASPESTPSVEVSLLTVEDFNELNFELVIADQENAQGIGLDRVSVHCTKSELDKICGRWNVVGEKLEDPDTGEMSEYSEIWTISNNGGRPVITGMLGYTDAEITGYFNEEERTLTFYMGEGCDMFTEVEDLTLTDGTVIESAYVGPCLLNKTFTTLQASFTLVGTVNEDATRIVWDIQNNFGIALLLFSHDDYKTVLKGGVIMDKPVFIDNNTITKR